MTWSYLESALASACPSFASEWAVLRGTLPSEAPPSAEDFLGALRSHVHRLAAEGRAAEIARLLYALERLLADADPILQDLLERTFLAPLAAECRGTGLDARLLLPHLGPRSRAAWDQALR